MERRIFAFEENESEAEISISSIVLFILTEGTFWRGIVAVKDNDFQRGIEARTPQNTKKLNCPEVDELRMIGRKSGMVYQEITATLRFEIFSKTPDVILL